MKEVIVGLVVIAIIGAILYFTYRDSQVAKHMTVEEARDALESGKIRSVVDVRDAAEFQAGHYPDAVHFELKTINAQTVQRKMISERIYSPVLVYCRSGKRAKAGAELLAKYGVDDVHYVSVPYEQLSKDE